jgi:surface antigen
MKTTHIAPIAMALLASFLLSSCMMANKGQTGAAGGAALGALGGQAIGNNTESTLLGAAIGGVLGYIIGNEMDKYDRQMLNRAYESTPVGETTSWVNPDHGYQYQVTPKKTYQGPNNQPCREAEIIAFIDGRRESTYTTACRDMNGRWQLQ